MTHIDFFTVFGSARRWTAGAQTKEKQQHDHDTDHHGLSVVYRC